METQEEKSRLGLGRGPATSEPGGLCTPSPGDREAASVQTQQPDWKHQVMPMAAGDQSWIRLGWESRKTGLNQGPSETPGHGMMVLGSPEGAKGRGGKPGKCEVPDTRRPFFISGTAL